MNRRALFGFGAGAAAVAVLPLPAIAKPDPANLITDLLAKSADFPLADEVSLRLSARLPTDYTVR